MKHWRSALQIAQINIIYIEFKYQNNRCSHNWRRLVNLLTIQFIILHQIWYDAWSIQVLLHYPPQKKIKIFKKKHISFWAYRTINGMAWELGLAASILSNYDDKWYVLNQQCTPHSFKILESWKLRTNVLSYS